MQDYMLKTLVGAVKEYGLSFGITLAIPGGVITGQLISAKEFKARFAQDFTGAMPGGPHPELRQTFATLGDDIEGGAEIEANLVHLKNAKYVTGTHMIPDGGDGMYWRGKLEDVTGFSLGSIAHIG